MKIMKSQKLFAVKGLCENWILFSFFKGLRLGAYRLAHDFYEVDYLPENDRVRYTISPDAGKEVLKRLLKLNHEIHEQEVKASLHVKGKIKKNKKLMHQNR